MARQKYVTYYDTLPIDDKAILLESEHGKKIDGNIFYILRHLSKDERYADYKIYFSSMGRNMRKFRAFLEAHGIENVNIVMLASDEYMRLLASAKYLINDTSFPPYYLKKEGQVYLNTWHGTPLKTLGKSDESGYHSITNIQKNFIVSDYILFPNEYMKDIMLRDYMLENISRGSSLMAGYPRNEIFFDTDSREQIREALELNGKKVYVYMPTYRGNVAKGKTSKSSVYLQYFLYELEKSLEEDEILYVNLHPLATDGVDFREFKKIKKFPAGYEVYEFLNIADALVTDYSSVFFDFAITGRKIVLFTYDEEEYLATRGMYMNINELPFPRVSDVPGLMDELRTSKSYDDTAFLEKFCPYERPDASEVICSKIILNEVTDAQILPIPSNGKENVIIYTGNLAKNGITTSLTSLLNEIDKTKRNYFVTFRSEHIAKNKEYLKTLPDGVNYIATSIDFSVTVKERIIRKLFRNKMINADKYMKLIGHRVAQGFEKNYGNAKIDHAIQFNGYETDVILELASFKGKKTIFVHSDVVEEIRLKGNQRPDVLKYAFSHYDNVAVVTEDIIAPTKKIENSARTKVVKNIISYKRILENADIIPEEPNWKACTVDFDTLNAVLDSDSKKFISIGRFSPEKGHERLVDAFAELHESMPNSHLIIIGGYAGSGCYEKLVQKINDMGLSERIILVLNTPNPYWILKKCDFFVLSSFYEGFGLVLAEADILDKPVISTDITGPRLFMRQHGGTLVENSRDGILNGMKMLSEGKIQPMRVDYEQYNREVLESFETLF